MALIERIEASAEALHKTASTSARLRWRRGGPQKLEERAMRLRINDLGKCADLSGTNGGRYGMPVDPASVERVIEAKGGSFLRESRLSDMLARGRFALRRDDLLR